MSDILIPTDVVRDQIRASDPAVSAWVSANAGSGKTHVLTQRVIRLLLEGVDPGKILCLTFTKAAAANMANRVFGTLASWIALDDAALDAAIAKIEGRPPGGRRRQRARRLFAEALETPGGLKVRTIHAFCTALLHQFPFEADVAAGFEVLEEHAEGELINDLRLQVLLEAANAPDTLIGRALAAAIPAAADVTFADVVREAIGKRAALTRWVTQAGGVAAALERLSYELGVEPADTVAAVEAELLDSPHLPASEWPALREALAEGGANDLQQVTRLDAVASGNEWRRLHNYLRIFCTDALQPRQSIVGAVVRNRHPGLFARLKLEQNRVCKLLERRRALMTRDRTTALVTIATAVLDRYRAEKERRGLLDYDDLIEKTLALFEKSSAAWVHYKLDLGIDHVLVDEAQDTSPQQWEVIRRLTAEFTAGEGARAGVKRSVFAVGDEKQSIYSFQGAAPHRFDEMRRHFEGLHIGSGMAFERVPLLTSFRSSPDILGAVDAVFGRPEAYGGLTAEPVATVHEAVRRHSPGLVELWELEEPAEKPEIEAWDAPFDAVSEESPQVRLAQRIARAVREMIARGVRVGDGEERRTVTPGDFLVLVRQRGTLFEAIIRALKETGVEVAGADRLVLTEHIAVMDLMSLGDALLLPEDDLALAEALKSPLLGLDDDGLFAIAHERQGSLRATLRRKAEESPTLAEANATLDRLAEAARRETPFAFYASLLGGGGRRKMLARLGPEASDALDEFLALALDYESRHAPSLQGFLAWLRAAQTEVKRDMDIVRDEVRVMTVHGAKGLEAPVVILADTTTKPAGPRDPPLLHLGARQGMDAATPIVWAGARSNDVPVVAEARQVALRAAEDEHSRLLYVALTRAEDRLIVCGARGMHQPPAGCWYQLVRDALLPNAKEAEEVDGKVTVRHWRKLPAAAEDHPAPAAVTGRAAEEVPDWLTRDAPAAPSGGAVLIPSAIPVGRPAFAQAGRAAMQAARKRGVYVHRLLAASPNVPADRREEAARRVLGRVKELDPGTADGIVRQVLGILAHPGFAPVFAPGSRAEVPIVGRVAARDGEVRAVSGQIDRLAVTAESVLIADFKSDRDPPRKPEDVPAGHVAQLALYAAVVARLYPGRAVKAALIFTESAALFEVPEAALHAALAKLGIGPA